MEKIQQLKRNKQHFYVIFERTDKKKTISSKLKKKLHKNVLNDATSKTIPRRKKKKFLTFYLTWMFEKLKRYLAQTKI